MVRRTRSQDKVLTVLKALSKPISAQDLYVEMRQDGTTTGLATVYRALDALKKTATTSPVSSAAAPSPSTSARCMT